MKISSVSFFKKENLSFRSRVIFLDGTAGAFAKQNEKWQNAALYQIKKLENNGNDDVVMLRYWDVDYNTSKICMDVFEKRGRRIFTNKYTDNINADNLHQRSKKENLVSLYEKIKEEEFVPVSKEKARFLNHVL